MADKHLPAKPLVTVVHAMPASLCAEMLNGKQWRSGSAKLWAITVPLDRDNYTLRVESDVTTLTRGPEIIAEGTVIERSPDEAVIQITRIARAPRLYMLMAIPAAVGVLALLVGLWQWGIIGLGLTVAVDLLIRTEVGRHRTMLEQVLRRLDKPY